MESATLTFTERQERKEYLTKRLRDAQTKQESSINYDGPSPSRVRAARRIVAVWEAGMKRRNARVRARMNKAAAVIRETILFGDRDKALAAIKKFERAKF